MPRSGVGSGAWGILGGTFDPIHYGHLALAESAREELGLDGVLFLPAGLPAHKPDRVVTPAPERVAMVEAAIADNRAFRLSRLEVDRAGPSYAVDTVAQLVAAPPVAGADPDGFIWLMSSEALAGLPDWHEPRRLLELTRVAVSARLGFPSPDRAWLTVKFPGLEERFVFLDGPELSHSASRIRRLVGEGRSIRYLVPPAVEAYIHAHRLYLSDPRSTAPA
ncbi:MAG: nicotinate-nucleotide adenylyltransferase [Candidatus Limnocylindrales bacterium]